MINFWLVFSALVIAIFSVGRLFWPDPDNSVSRRSEELINKLRTDLSGNGVAGVFGRLTFFIIYILYIPYNYPLIGLTASFLIMVVVFLI